MTEKHIKVDYLARVEGEGSLYVKMDGDEVVDVQFNIFEPPRFFEALLLGRKYTEVPDITARICGICPIAYQMSSVHALETAFGVQIDGPIRELRRLIYCGEWIESHALHIFLLHAPDFLGYQDGVQLAKDSPELVQKGLALKKAGNDLMTLIGGREIHPINVRVGGFYRVPTRQEVQSIRPQIENARDIALEAVDIVSSFDFPKFDRDYEFVALRHPDEYPFNEGRLVSNKGLDIDIADFNTYFEERHVKRTHALHAVIKSRSNYHVGPLARYNLNFDRFPAVVQEAALKAGLNPTCQNPFKSIIVRAVETLFACEEALRIIDGYKPPAEPYIDIPVRAAVGFGCTEAPRGICFHRYEVDAQGLITDALIVPPTSQNQLTIEEDLRYFIAQRLHLPDAMLQWQCEQAIRNYDPCISCATHFLDLEVERT